MASYLKTKNRIQAQVRLRGVKIFKTFADKKSARAWAINKETEIMRGKKYELDKKLIYQEIHFKLEKGIITLEEAQKMWLKKVKQLKKEEAK